MKINTHAARITCELTVGFHINWTAFKLGGLVEACSPRIRDVVGLNAGNIKPKTLT